MITPNASDLTLSSNPAIAADATEPPSPRISTAANWRTAAEHQREKPTRLQQRQSCRGRRRAEDDAERCDGGDDRGGLTVDRPCAGRAVVGLAHGAVWRR
jgi:hypothetical protein